MITVDIDFESYSTQFEDFYELDHIEEFDDLVEDLNDWYGDAFVDVTELPDNKYRIDVTEDTREFYDKYGDGRIFMKDGDEEYYIGQ